MIKLYRKKRKKSLQEGKSQNYFKYAIGETALLVIGILIAMYIDNLNTISVNKKKERASYEQLKRQLIDDRTIITTSRDLNETVIQQYGYAITLIETNDRSKIDTLSKITASLYFYTDFDRNGTIYQNLINTGESKIMKNKEVLGEVQRLEETYLFLRRMGNIHYENLVYDVNPDIKKTFKLLDQSVRDVDKLYSVDFQNHFALIHYIATEKGKIYDKSIDQITRIIELIDKELM